MERLCDKCGSLVGGNVKFCPMCGAPMKSAVDLGKDDARPDSGLPQRVDTQNSGYSAPQYGRNITPSSPQQGQAMTTGQWFGTILLCTILGPISLILTIVWGFSSSTPEPKRSFCKAMFIVSIIMYIFAIISGAAVSSIIEKQISRYYDMVPWVNF